MKKWLLGLLLLFGLSPSVVSAADSFDVASRQALAIEADTGQILYSKDSDTKVAVGSITKLLTAYLVYESLASNDISLNTPVDISDYPYYLTVHPDTTNVLLDRRSYTVDQLLNATLIASSDSAAIALAEKIEGSEPKFVDRMRQKLSDWGISGATIVTASGLPNSIIDSNRYPGSSRSDENKLSARDIAIIARHLYQDYPDSIKVTSKQNISIDGRTYLSTNSMLEDFPYYRAGIRGLGVSYSQSGGASFVALATENSIPIISVVLNANNSDKDVNNRFVATNQLLTYIATNFKAETIVAKGETYQNSVSPVIDGVKGEVAAVADQDLIFLNQTEQEVPSARFRLDQAKGLEAEVKKGSSLGSLTLEADTKDFLDGNLPSVKMVAEESVDRAIFYQVWWNQFVRYVNENL